MFCQAGYGSRGRGPILPRDLQNSSWTPSRTQRSWRLLTSSGIRIFGLASDNKPRLMQSCKARKLWHRWMLMYSMDQMILHSSCQFCPRSQAASPNHYPFHSSWSNRRSHESKRPPRLKLIGHLHRSCNQVGGGDIFCRIEICQRNAPPCHQAPLLELEPHLWKKHVSQEIDSLQRRI